MMVTSCDDAGTRRRLLLHVGMHKTGSTSIQRFLFANRARLHDRGVLYPDGPFVEPGHAAHHALAWRILGRPGFTDLSHWRAAVEFIRSDASRVVVLSSEDFSLLDTDQIKALAEFLEDFDVRVVQVIRNAWGYLTSNYKSNIGRTSMTDSFRTFMLREAPHLEYARRADAWAAAFGDGSVSMPILDKLAEHGGVVRYFTDLIAPGLYEELAAGEPEPRLNTSVDDRAVRWLRGLNRFGARTHLDVTEKSALGRLKKRLALQGRAGRAARVVDDIVPGTFWKRSDLEWLRPRVIAWNDDFYPRYAPLADRSYLDL
jgi:hypothetical protein